MEGVNFLKLKKTINLLRDALTELNEVEEFVELLERELNEYESLIDKDSYVPKPKLIKSRISRLIERMKFAQEEGLGCVGIKLLLKGDVSSIDKKGLFNYIVSYIDGRVRPYDMVFILDNDVIGLVIPLKIKKDLENVVKRIENMLLNIKAQTYSSKSILLNFKINSFLVDGSSSVDEVFSRLAKSE